MNRNRAWARHSLAVPMMLAVASCTVVPAPETPQPAPPAPVAAPSAPAPAPVLPWDERALDPGSWRYDAGSRTASFVPAPGGAPLLTMACSGGGIRLAAGLSGNVSLHTSEGIDQIRFDGGNAMLPGRDIRLDRIAFSRGRFALEGPSGTLTLPVQAEIGRVIEDCR